MYPRLRLHCGRTSYAEELTGPESEDGFPAGPTSELTRFIISGLVWT
jgi:hypothetical protein